jgi:hypothetical protein
MRTGQPLLLSLLVRNLLDNAVRYSPRGSQVDITLTPVSFAYAITARASARGAGAHRRALLSPSGPGCSPAAAWALYRPAHRRAARDDGEFRQRPRRRIRGAHSLVAALLL